MLCRYRMLFPQDFGIFLAKSSIGPILPWHLCLKKNESSVNSFQARLVAQHSSEKVLCLQGSLPRPHIQQAASLEAGLRVSRKMSKSGVSNNLSAWLWFGQKHPMDVISWTQPRAAMLPNPTHCCEDRDVEPCWKVRPALEQMCQASVSSKEN